MAKKRVQRVVVKVGTSSLTEGFNLSVRKVSAIVADVMRLRKDKVEVIIVSSGAIAAGMGELGLRQKPQDVKKLQALAAIGQNELMKAYGKCFARYKQKVAQVLLTKKDFTDRKSYLNIKNTLTQLLESGVVPIINENDSVSVEEILSGDNDNLAAIVAVNMESDALVMLSDHGFKMKKTDKHAVAVIPEITSEVRKAAGGGSARGKGGMASKIKAAEKTMNAGVDLFIVDARKKNAVTKILFNPARKTILSVNATLFPSQKKLTDREHWLLYSSKAVGALVVDAGCERALKQKGGSLLPSGIIGVAGPFSVGDVIDVLNEAGVKIARGITNYTAADIRKIKGKKSTEVSKILGKKCKCEVVYRGNMVVSGK